MLRRKRKAAIYGYMQQAHIKIHVENKHPIQLKDFTSSLEAMADEYKRHLKTRGYNPNDDEVILYLHKVESGSIDIILAATEALLPVVQISNEYSSFLQHLRGYTDYFLGKGEKPEDINVKSCENIRDIQNMISNNPQSSYNITIENCDIHSFNVGHTYTESNGVQNRCGEEILSLKAPDSRVHTEVLLVWDQIKRGQGEESGRTGDKATIEEVYDTSLSVYFPEDSADIKHQMTAEKFNPLKKAFVVDVELMVVQGKPRAYKILKLHESMD